MRKIILDLCGGTGSWSKPYNDGGYDVRLITLPEHDVLNWENDTEIIQAIASGNVYGILAAPPCTMFSIARRNAKLPPDYAGALSIVDACQNIIRTCALRGGLKFWAMENPRGKLRYFIGLPKHTLYQWQFGGQHKKAFDLWGYYDAPRPTVKVEPSFDVDKSWQKPVCPPEYAHMKLNREAVRAITPAGFAKAFYEANI